MEDFFTDKEMISRFLESQLKRQRRWRPLNSKNLKDLTEWDRYYKW